VLSRSLQFSLFVYGLHVAGCTGTEPSLTSSGQDDGGKGAAGGSGGSANTASGGMASGASGGTLATGGSGSGTGGTPGAGGSGAGTNAAGTSTSDGTGAGGAKTGGTGGGPSVGGAPASAGRPNVGGAGMGNAGGTTGAFGGRPGTGAAGGGVGRGGAPMGGAPAIGGAPGAGAGGMAGSSSVNTCPAGSHSTQGTKHCGMSDTGTASGNYTYNIYSDGKGSGCMTTYGVDATFSASWTNVGDWIARVGLAFDKTKTYDQIGIFASDFAYTTTGVTSGGFGNIGIYGWSVNPLHEYYIIEDWLGKRPNFTKVDTLTIDGEGTYEIQTNTQNDQPNITGTNATFVQFWSVRTEPRYCGHISVSKHFDKWKSLGLTLGNLEEARILVEAQNNTGAIDFTTATVVVTKQ
jgi:hypothetical protein